eukprot:362215-Chlamydomonas_euryale.AAC.1
MAWHGCRRPWALGRPLRCQPRPAAARSTDARASAAPSARSTTEGAVKHACQDRRYAVSAVHNRGC